MRDSYLYISFIIKCDCKELVEIGVYLPKIEEKKKAKWTTFYGWTKITKLDNISRMERVLIWVLK